MHSGRCLQMAAITAVYCTATVCCCCGAACGDFHADVGLCMPCRPSGGSWASLHVGVIMGILLAAIAGALLCGLAACCCLRCRRRVRQVGLLPACLDWPVQMYLISQMIIRAAAQLLSLQIDMCGSAPVLMLQYMQRWACAVISVTSLSCGACVQGRTGGSLPSWLLPTPSPEAKEAAPEEARKSPLNLRHKYHGGSYTLSACGLVENAQLTLPRAEGS